MTETTTTTVVVEVWDKVKNEWVNESRTTTTRIDPVRRNQGFTATYGATPDHH